MNNNTGLSSSNRADSLSSGKKQKFKIPKDMPQNILIVKNENENRNGIVLNGAKRTQKETFSSHLKGDLASLPSFKQVDHNSRQNLYRAKLRVCH